MGFISALVYNLIPIVLFSIAAIIAKSGKKYKIFLILGVIAGIIPLFGAVAQLYRDNGFGEYKYVLADIAVFLLAFVVFFIITYKNCSKCEEEKGTSACKVSADGRKIITTTIVIGSILIMVFSLFYLPKVCYITKLVELKTSELRASGRNTEFKLTFRTPSDMGKESKFEAYLARRDAAKNGTDLESLYVDAESETVTIGKDYYTVFKNGDVIKNHEPYKYKSVANIWLACILATAAAMIVIIVIAVNKKPVMEIIEEAPDKNDEFWGASLSDLSANYLNNKPKETIKETVDKPITFEATTESISEENNKPITNENLIEKNEKKEETATITDVADSLLKYKQLLDMGAISEEEYNDIKSKLLKF